MKKFDDPFAQFFVELRRDYRKSPIEVIVTAIGLVLAVPFINLLNHWFG